MNKRNALICTVGTSLFTNLDRLTGETPNAPENWREIISAYQKANWNSMSRELLKVKPTERICGAEINTIEEVKEKNWLSLKKVYFLVSDTSKGENTGKLLKRYFEKRTDLKLQKVEYHTVEKLQDKEPVDFKIHGLRNLVRQIGKCIELSGGPKFTVIDATGGYKAQIAIGVLIGQALNIPVVYKHELFKEIIDFPPLPITFDYSILAENASLLRDFETGKTYSLDEIENFDEKLRVLLSEVDIDGKTLFGLSAIGQIYLTGFRIRYPKKVTLMPVPESKRRLPSFRSDHYPIGFKDFLNKIWQENPWIVTIYTLPYDKQKSMKGIGFKVRNDGEKKKLIGTYEDKKNFRARFGIDIMEESEKSLARAAVLLNDKYRK